MAVSSGTTGRFFFRRTASFEFSGSIGRPCKGTSSIPSLASPLAGCLGNRAKLLPQQPEHVVRVLVPRTAHSAQPHRPQVRVGRDVGARAVQLVQSEPEGIGIHPDQVLENAVGRNARRRGRRLSICMGQPIPTSQKHLFVSFPTLIYVVNAF